MNESSFLFILESTKAFEDLAINFDSPSSKFVWKICFWGLS